MEIKLDLILDILNTEKINRRIVMKHVKEAIQLQRAESVFCFMHDFSKYKDNDLRKISYIAVSETEKNYIWNDGENYPDIESEKNWRDRITNRIISFLKIKKKVK